MTRPGRRAGELLRPFVVPAVTTVVVTVFVVIINMRVSDAVLLGLVAGGIALLWPLLDRGEFYDWPAPELGRLDGSRRDVTALSWTFMGRDGRVAEMAVRRLRGVAEHRLARHGVHLPGGLSEGGTGVNPASAEARARELLGDRAWRALIGHGGVMPSPRDVQHCVEVLERLGPTSARTPEGPDPAPAHAGPVDPTPEGRTHP